MPTVFSHPAVPLAIGLGLGSKVVSKRLLVAGVVTSILPDLDVLAFRFDIPYVSALGHRGFTHSLSFALLVALIGTAASRTLHTTFRTAFLFLFLATASHGILDAFTDGGLGIAFLWPWSAERFFAPIRPIRVSPLSISRFFSQRGVSVLQSELIWIGLPCVLAALALSLHRFGHFQNPNDR